MLALRYLSKNRSNLDAELGSIDRKKDITVWRNITEIVKVPQVWMYLIGNLFTLGIIFGGATVIYTILMTDPLGPYHGSGRRDLFQQHRFHDFLLCGSSSDRQIPGQTLGTQLSLDRHCKQGPSCYHLSHRRQFFNIKTSASYTSSAESCSVRLCRL